MAEYKINEAETLKHKDHPEIAVMGAVSGTAVGAGVGMAVGGPVGAAIGAAVGAISGGLGASATLDDSEDVARDTDLHTTDKH